MSPENLERHRSALGVLKEALTDGGDDKETVEFHKTALRHMKGILTAYERWIKAKEAK